MMVKWLFGALVTCVLVITVVIGYGYLRGYNIDTEVCIYCGMNRRHIFLADLSVFGIGYGYKTGRYSSLTDHFGMCHVWKCERLEAHYRGQVGIGWYDIESKVDYYLMLLDKHCGDYDLVEYHKIKGEYESDIETLSIIDVPVEMK